MLIPISTGFYEDATKPIASQECTNWLPQIPQADSLGKMQLKQPAGISLFTTAGTKIMRGHHVMDSIAYSVNGNFLYRINSDGTSTSLGAITGSGRVSMADNGVQICIVVPSGNAYIYTVSGGLVTITDADFTTTLGPSEGVKFKDGYFVHWNNSSAASTKPIFFISNLNDGTAYGALDFGTAEADPDAITNIHVHRNQLYVCGKETIEPFQNIGGADFPFQRIRGGLVPKGVKSTYSVVEFDQSFVFVGSSINERAAIWKFSGGGAIKISTASIDRIMQEYTDTEIADIFCTTYAEDGAFIVNVHMKDRTFAYDAAASALGGKPIWHERKSKDVNGQLINWRVNHIVEAYGSLLVGDNQGASIGKMDRAVYTEYGDSMNQVVTTMAIDNEGEPVTFSEMELTCHSGSAGATDSEPHVSRSISDDGGYTFGNQTKRSLGKQGEYKKRQIWRKEGQSYRYRVYKFVIDEPIKTAIIKLEVQAR